MGADYQSLLALDAKLQRAGHHGLTDRWRDTLEAFYSHPTAKTLVAQVGRGGAKSFTAAKVALNEALNGNWNVPPGEIHYFCFVSASVAEANQRLTLLQSFLTALNIDHKVSEDTIHLQGMRVGFKVFAQSIAAVSGWRCFGAALDEMAKWRSAKDAKNPAKEIAISIASMMITHENARTLMISSPWSTQTEHYKRFQRGDTSQQLVITAPSWVMNPDGITERSAREKSDSEAHFRREFLAVASQSLEDGFFPEAIIQRNIDSGRSHIGIATPNTRWFVGIDPAFSASVKSDLFGVAVVKSEVGALDPLYQTREPRITTVQECHGWKPEGSATGMVQKLKQDVLNRYGINRVFSDKFEGFSFRDVAKAQNVNVEVWKGDAEDGSTIAFYKSVRAAMFDGAFRIPDYEPLINEFRACASELSDAGRESIRLPKLPTGSHCDILSSVVLSGALALQRPANLPENRMSNWELNERAANQRRFIASFCGGL